MLSASSALQQTTSSPPDLLPSSGSSFHGGGAVAAAGLHAGPADVQPGQFGTVLKELLNGDVTHMQL